MVVSLAVTLALVVVGAGARANIRAPRGEVAMPSSAIRAGAPTTHLRVVHEDLTFRCRERLCQVTATYAIQSDVPEELDLTFVLPVDGPVTTTIGQTKTKAAVGRLDASPREFGSRLDLRLAYEQPDGSPLPPLYQAVAHLAFAPGTNRVSFSYEQPLGALERGRSYFHAGRMVPHLIYVLWPLREWERDRGVEIALRIEMDREPPGWWKRTFGHPPGVRCDDITGRSAQVGPRLIYSAALTGQFPDYLSCWIGDRAE